MNECPTNIAFIIAMPNDFSYNMSINLVPLCTAVINSFTDAQRIAY